jgi:hypothetical protein
VPRPLTATQNRLSGGSVGVGESEAFEIQVYDYRDPAMTTSDVARIGPGGQVAAMLVEWPAPPYFFRSGSVLVIYVGSEQRIVDLLSDMLGPPFAGGSASATPSPSPSPGPTVTRVS